MTGLLLLLAAALLGPAPRPAAVAPPDSVGQETRGGQRFVKHRVGSGETLFAIAKRYRVKVDQLTAANPQLANGLGIGQTVFVPRPAAGAGATSPKTAKNTAKNTATTAAAAAPARYTVAKGDNLYALAKRFQITRDDIIRLNKLPADGQVKVGQQLLLRTEAAATEAVAATTKTAAPDPKPTAAEAKPEKTAAAAADPKPAPDPAKPAQVATVTPAPAKEEAPAKDEAPTRASEVVSRVTETGLGGAIEKSGTDKYLALHKTAPVGTIMQVKNLMTNQSVYVRVIGKLPDTGENNNVLVRVSPRALQKLGTADSRFRVETSYVP